MKARMSLRPLPRFLAWGLVAAGALTLAGCSTISDTMSAMNPFSSSGPKMAPLEPIKTTADIRTRWTATAAKAGNYAFAPAVAGSSVYVAGGDGTVARLDDGAQVWRINAGQPLSAGVGSDGKLVVVGTPKGEVLAFSAADGKPLWQARASSEILAAPTVGDDGVAVKSGDNRVFLFDLEGRRKWTYQRATPPLSLRSTAAPVFADRYLFVGFPGGKLVALDLKNGAPVWEGTVALPKGTTELDRVADIVSLPVIDGRQVCAVAFQGRIACFDLGQGGQLIWARDFSSAAGLTLDSRYVFVTDDKGAVHALDRSTGASVWKQDKLLNRRVSAPVVKRGLVAVADGQGIVHFLSRDDGAFAARAQTDGTPVVAPPQTMGSAFLVQTSGGTVTAMDVQ
ncbi:MAG TPA: outer membrane protein assembly factor BamB [Rhodocyclaceae bacterium]|nr:outer membrane protein assembly factor BamB [Rhodocyclaceae bacterium]